MPFTTRYSNILAVVRYLWKEHLVFHYPADKNEMDNFDKKVQKSYTWCLYCTIIFFRHWDIEKGNLYMNIRNKLLFLLLSGLPDFLY